LIYILTYDRNCEWHILGLYTDKSKADEQCAKFNGKRGPKNHFVTCWKPDADGGKELPERSLGAR
jgi:hypothetical protein